MQNVNNGLVQAARFRSGHAICAAARVDTRAPHGFARVDVADAGDFVLVEEE